MPRKIIASVAVLIMLCSLAVHPAFADVYRIEYQVDTNGNLVQVNGQQFSVIISDLRTRYIETGETEIVTVTTDPAIAELAVASSDERYVTAKVEGHTLYLQGVQPGQAVITVTAKAEGLLSALAKFEAKVYDPEPIVVVPTVNKTALGTTINAAEAQLVSAVEGDEPGQYPVGAKATLQAALDVAKAVYSDANATQQQVNSALALLSAAVATFEASEVPAADKAALTSAIAAAEQVIATAQPGTEPGQYPQTAIDTFRTAINAAKAVQDNAGATQSQVDQATATLNAARTTFEASVVTEPIGYGDNILLSKTQDGFQGNSDSFGPSASADGRYVVFQSLSTNFATNTSPQYNIYLKDTVTGELRQITNGNNRSMLPVISGDGRFVVFNSEASNLTTDPYLGGCSLFLYEVSGDNLIRLVQNVDFGERPAISFTGRFIAFVSPNSQLSQDDSNGGAADVFVLDRENNNAISLESKWTDGSQSEFNVMMPCISQDGRYVSFAGMNLFPGDDDGSIDLFLRDRELQTTRTISDDIQVGLMPTASMSADGRYVLFESDRKLTAEASDRYTNIYLFDRTVVSGSSFTCISQNGAVANEYAAFGRISPNGRYVTFSSGASNLVPGDTNNEADVFRYDMLTGEYSLISIASDGTQGNSYSDRSEATNEGIVVFESYASNLVGTDANGSYDVFLHVNQPVSDPVPASDISVINNEGANDVVTVTNLSQGDTVTVYDAASGGNVLGSSTVTSGTSATVPVNLGVQAGSVWVSVTGAGKLESSRTKIDYPVEIPAETGTRSMYQMAYDPVNERYVAVYRWDGTSRADLRGRFVYPDGSVGLEFMVQADCYFATTPDIVYNSAEQQFLVVWRDSTNSIKGQLINSDGSTDSAPITIHSGGSDYAMEPDVAYDSINNRFLVVFTWAPAADWQAADIYGQMINADGQLMGECVQMVNTAERETVPQIAYNSAQGNYLMVYRTGSIINGKFINANGSPETAIAVASVNSTYQDSPAISWSSYTNSFLVVWDDRRPGVDSSSIYGHIIDATGNRVGSELAICTAAGYQNHPKAGAFAGGFIVTWEDERNLWENYWDQTDIYAQIVGNNGSLVGGNVGVGPVADADGQCLPVLATSGPAASRVIIYEDEADETVVHTFALLIGPPTPAPQASTVTAFNGIGATDSVAITSLSAGNTVRVYNAATGGQLLGSGIVEDAKTHAIISTLDFGTSSYGYVWVTLTAPGMNESTRVQTFFSVELPEISLVSASTSGLSGDYASGRPSVSADGRYVAFHSEATDLIAGRSTTIQQIYLRDLQSGTTILVSSAADGTWANGTCYQPTISADGRTVAFISEASNLVSGDTNGKWDVFVKDLATGSIERANVPNFADQGTLGTEANGDSSGWSYQDACRPVLSADGNLIAFVSYATNLVPDDSGVHLDIFLHNRTTKETSKVTWADGGGVTDSWSAFLAFSSDGQHLAFASKASNLIPGDTNNAADVFVYNRTSDTLERISLMPDGTQGTAHSGGIIDSSDSLKVSISADGNLVCFISYNKLTSNDSDTDGDVFVYDLRTGTTTLVSLGYNDVPAPDTSCEQPMLSADGRYAAFTCQAKLTAGELGDSMYLYVRDLLTGTTRLVAVYGGQTHPAFSADGELLVFEAAQRFSPLDVNSGRDIYLIQQSTPNV